MAALPGDDELQALLAEMREAPGAPCAPPRPAHPPGKPGKRAPPAAAGDIKIGIHAASGRLPAGPPAPDILSDEREATLRALVAGDDVLWNARVEFIAAENRALIACSELGRLGSAAHDFLDAREQQRLAADEAVRWRHMSRLAGEFKDMVAETLGNKWQRHFEKWLYSRRAVCPTCPAGCFPLGPEAEVDDELQRKLEAAGASTQQAVFIAKMAGKASNKAAAALSRAAPALGKVKVKEIVMQEGERVRTKLVLSCAGVSMEVNSDHYSKLAALLRRSSHLGRDSDFSGGAGEGLGGAATAAVFRLLARYSTFQGAHYRAGGFQAAIHGGCFDVLLSEFGCILECFASPMNCRYEHFCSAHIATDASFGSIGSFFHFRPTSGSFEANPPFDDATIQKMVAHMEMLLGSSEKPLNFAIIIPYLPDQQGWNLVYNSIYKRAHLKVLQSEHGYYEGSQHDRINRFRIAPFDTSVIFLQNEAGRSKWPATKAKLRLLREAFKPKLELNPHSLAFQGGNREHDSDDEAADLPQGYVKAAPAARAAPGAAAAAAAAGTGRPGDWDCPACGQLVFAKKTVCGKCKALKPSAAACSSHAAASAAATEGGGARGVKTGGSADVGGSSGGTAPGPPASSSFPRHVAQGRHGDKKRKNVAQGRHGDKKRKNQVHGV